MGNRSCTMGVLKTLTDEYFGKTVRGEDCIKYGIDTEHPTRDLTEEERAFLTGLSSYTMFLDRSLFFQVKDLMRHTELMLSGEECVQEPSESDEPQRDINVLETLLKEPDVQENCELKEVLEKQLDAMRDDLKKNGGSGKPARLLGKYEHGNGEKSQVILYVKNIEQRAKDDARNTMLLMGQALLHEYFHSFNRHAGEGGVEHIWWIEEPMAEYGSLAVLDGVAQSGLPVAKDAGEALTYTHDFVKSKQKCKGMMAAYGFGAYLFAAHKDECRSFLARYANVSSLMDECEKNSLVFKYMLYPHYPSSRYLEELTYNMLLELI